MEDQERTTVRECPDKRPCGDHCGSGPCRRRCDVCTRMAWGDEPDPCPACPDSLTRALTPEWLIKRMKDHGALDKVAAIEERDWLIHRLVDLGVLPDGIETFGPVGVTYTRNGRIVNVKVTVRSDE